uniref:dihydrofolate reductase n=1 Tax=viral metagenome TaxID=1070528 RepID=A0A6C0JVI2_9ZZZZ
MKISRFNIIALIDNQGGLSKDGRIPFYFKSWRDLFGNKTIGSNKNNAVVMGRKTFENILESKPLPNRQNFIISESYDQKDHNDIVVYKSILQCLAGIENRGHSKKYDEVWIIGGGRMFRECYKKLLCYCNKIVLGIIKTDGYECDDRFPYSELKKSNIENKIELKTPDYELSVYHPKIEHQEENYINLLKSIIEKNEKYFETDGNERIEYLRLQNQTLSFVLTDEFPIITTRMINFKEYVSSVFCDDIGNMEFSNDTLGFRLKCDKMFTGSKNYGSSDEIKFVSDDCDKLNEIVSYLINNNDIILNVSRNVNLNPFYIPFFIRLSVSTSKKYLDTSVSCNQMEMFKHFPIYLSYISLFSSCVAYLLNVKPRKLFFYFSDSLINIKYIKFVNKQIENDPKPFPVLLIKNTAETKNLSDFTVENFDLLRYESWQNMVFETHCS